MTSIFKFIALLLLFNISLSQTILLAQIARQDSTNAPILPAHLTISHIEINDQFIDFRQLSDANYRNSLEFGESLHQSIDTILPFYNYPQTMNLPHSLNNLTFHFTAIEWGAPHKIKYSYYLEGFEEEWSVASTNTFATYQNLWHGDYTLRVKSMGEGLIWGEPYSYSFTIRRPWWLSWWAYVIYICIAIVYGVGIYYFVQRRKAKVVEIKRLIAENRLLAFSNIVIKKTPTKEGSFLELVNKTLEAHLSDENFGIAELCEVLKISRTQLHRKLKRLTGQSTSHYIRSLRLDIAKGMLEKTNLNVSEVAFSVGFSNAAYFSKVFKEEFGYAPKEAR